MKPPIALLAVLPLLALGHTASARDKVAAKMEVPGVFQDLVECRNLADPAKRLACYDQKVAALQHAEAKHDIVIADKEAVREARKGLFGFDLPRIKLFDGGASDQAFQRIETTIKSARVVNASGQWQIVLDDGAVWSQVDSQPLAVDPRPGSKIVIRRAAFGSFAANIDGQPAIKMRRVQ